MFRSSKRSLVSVVLKSMPSKSESTSRCAWFAVERVRFARSQAVRSRRKLRGLRLLFRSLRCLRLK